MQNKQLLRTHFEPRVLFLQILKIILFDRKQIKSEIIFFKIAINLVGIALMCLIAVGFKTKLTSVILVLWLFGLNMSMHNFWAHSPKERQGESSNFTLLDYPDIV